ncbi:MAG: 23S rRNA (adenine(1618)-N(6))-methyltransferase RlmF [Flavobacteriia bacterium]|jgi:23S rRNA (adenine1618-N6)-methyltransferase
MTESKSKLHPRNKHNNLYDFDLLVGETPELKDFILLNPKGEQTIDFANQNTVKCLNKALLKSYYKIDFWDIPNNYLCPPIPGRADYIHYLADLLDLKAKKEIKCLDIGTGSNCIYPIIGVQEYQWNFVASDIDFLAVRNAKEIISQNNSLEGKIEIRLQKNPRFMFKDVILEKEFFDLTLCNPPFHSSEEEANKGSLRKIKNLQGEKKPKVELNFGGKNNELWCEGGEAKFIKDMIFESKHFAKNCNWFTCLVSKKENLRAIYKILKKVEVKESRTIEMAQGNKVSRFVAWRF